MTGNPVRREFFAAPPIAPGVRGRRLLVFGGSQGSAALNRAMIEAAPLLAQERLEVIHQTGEKRVEEVRGAYRDLPEGWKLEAFLSNLDEQMSWCDLVLCRAGSMTLSELAAAGRPSVLVPLASSTHGHQLENARAFADAGAAVVLEEGKLSGTTLSQTLVTLLASPDRLARMGDQARLLSHSDAARRLADILFEIEREAP